MLVLRYCVVGFGDTGILLYTLSGFCVRTLPLLTHILSSSDMHARLSRDILALPLLHDARTFSFLAILLALPRLFTILHDLSLGVDVEHLAGCIIIVDSCSGAPCSVTREKDGSQ